MASAIQSSVSIVRRSCRSGKARTSAAFNVGCDKGLADAARQDEGEPSAFDLLVLRNDIHEPVDMRQSTSDHAPAGSAGQPRPSAAPRDLHRQRRQDPTAPKIQRRKPSRAKSPHRAGDGPRKPAAASKACPKCVPEIEQGPDHRLHVHQGPRSPPSSGYFCRMAYSRGCKNAWVYAWVSIGCLWTGAWLTGVRGSMYRSHPRLPENTSRQWASSQAKKCASRNQPIFSRPPHSRIEIPVPNRVSSTAVSATTNTG